MIKQMSIKSFLLEFESESIPYFGSDDKRLYLGAIINFRYYIGKDYLYFHSFQSTEYSNGIGSNAMNELLKLIDKHKVRLEGHVNSYANGPLNNKMLIEWYSKFGFIKTIKECPECSDGQLSWIIVRNPV